MRVIAMQHVIFGFIAAALAGCQDNGTFVNSRHFEDGDTLLTGAAVRSINRQQYERDSSTGRLQPAYITCAEPSPDVAMTVAKAFGASSSLSAKGLPANVEPKVAAAIAVSQAASVAQLGERLATIQLLRDGLYRACEAYANGAISPLTYAVMVSRYDDTMVTLLSSELAAGAFGRSLAAIDAEASGSSKATGDFLDKRERSLETERNLSREESEKESLQYSYDESRSQEDELRQQMAEEQERRNGLAADLNAAQTAAATPPTAAESDTIDSLKSSLSRSDETISKLNTQLTESRSKSRDLFAKLTDARKKVQTARDEHQANLSAEATSLAAAKATAAGGIAPGKQAPEVAEIIHQIQLSFMKDINFDAVEIACLTALDEFRGKQNSAESALVTLCKDAAVQKTLKQRLDRPEPKTNAEPLPLN